MAIDPGRDLWVFGYGSLMWQPGFAYAEAVHARLVGYHRAFCIYSVHYRGSLARPGLVLGLDRGGVCEGIAFRIPSRQAAATLRYLRRREQIYGVYREAIVPITLLRTERTDVYASTYLVERQHPSFAGALALRDEARVIRGAKGVSGTNLDYLGNTIAHLRELGIREPRLERLRVVAGAFAVRDRKGGRFIERALSVARLGARQALRLRRLRPEQRKRFIHRIALDARGGGDKSSR
jgi:cation transport protein ChaC